MLKAIIWDVQHGLAVTIVTPNNRHIQIDLGTGSYGSNNRLFSPLRHLKYVWGVSQLDCVIFTHPHTDHLDDIFNFDELSPRTICRPNHLTDQEIRNGNASSDSAIINGYLGLNYSSRGMVVAENDRLEGLNNWGGATINTFIPRTCATSNLNNHSVVTVISYAGIKLLIPGDNEPPSWNELLSQPDFVNAINGTHILIAPHHGRASGYSAELFRYISPKLVIVSDGQVCDTTAVNRYSQQASGWVVAKRNGNPVERKCLTTRNDGPLLVECWQEGITPYLGVTID